MRTLVVLHVLVVWLQTLHTLHYCWRYANAFTSFQAAAGWKNIKLMWYMLHTEHFVSCYVFKTAFRKLIFWYANSLEEYALHSVAQATASEKNQHLLLLKHKLNITFTEEDLLQDCWIRLWLHGMRSGYSPCIPAFSLLGWGYTILTMQ